MTDDDFQWVEKTGALFRPDQFRDPPAEQKTSEIDWEAIHVLCGGGLWHFSTRQRCYKRLDGFDGVLASVLNHAMMPVLVEASVGLKGGIDLHYHRDTIGCGTEVSTALRWRLRACFQCVEFKDSMQCIYRLAHPLDHMSKAGERWSTDPGQFIAPEPENKPRPSLGCDFCPRDSDTLGFDHNVRGCVDHFSTARLHVSRLASGGLVHCPETCAETARFERDAANVDRVLYAEASGYRTQLDQKSPPTRPRADPEPLPLVGTTPHYEWP